MTRSLIVLVPADQLHSSGGDREIYSHTRLCEELRSEFDGTVDVRVDHQDSDDPNAILLLLREEPSEWMRSLPGEARAKLFSRTLVLLAYRAPEILEVLERFGLAGGVEYRRYTLWQSRPPTSDVGYRVAGVRSVVERLNGECAKEPFATAKYCFYQTQTSRTLPAALAEYCTALAEASNLNSPTFGE